MALRCPMDISNLPGAQQQTRRMLLQLATAMPGIPNPEIPVAFSMPITQD